MIKSLIDEYEEFFFFMDWSFLSLEKFKESWLEIRYVILLGFFIIV